MPQTQRPGVRALCARPGRSVSRVGGTLTVRQAECAAHPVTSISRENRRPANPGRVFCCRCWLICPPPPMGLRKMRGGFDSRPARMLFQANVGRVGRWVRGWVISTRRGMGKGSPMPDGADGETVGSHPGDVTAGRDRQLCTLTWFHLLSIPTAQCGGSVCPVPAVGANPTRLDCPTCRGRCPTNGQGKPGAP